MAVNGEKARAFLPADDEEAIRQRVADAKAVEERAAHEQAIKHEQSSMRWALVIFAGGTCFWLLSYADWLPAILTKILAGSEDRTDQRFLWLVMAGMGLALATLSYLDLRALRLGTERARKLAYVAKMVSATVVVLGCIAFLGAILLLLGIVISDWLASDGHRFPLVIVSYLVHWPILMAILFSLPWIEGLVRPARLIFALVVLSALLAADVAVGSIIVWDEWVQIVQDRHLPVWIAFLVAIPNVLIAPFLLWGIVIAVRRLRDLTAQRLPNATDHS